MFLYCFDEAMKKELEMKNFKQIKKPDNQDYWVFIINKDKNNFDFSKYDNSKFKISNKLNF